MNGAGLFGSVTPSPDEPKGSRQNWRTPRGVFSQLDRMFGPFGLDVAASDEWHLCDRYFTEERSAFAIGAGWGPVPAFCNPPFKQTGAFLDRLFEHSESYGVTCVALVLASVSSRWFHLAASRGTVFVPSARVSYWHPDEVSAGGFNRDSVVIVFGPEWAPRKGTWSIQPIDLRNGDQFNLFPNK